MIAALESSPPVSSAPGVDLRGKHREHTGEIDGASLDTFVASDDDAAKRTVINALRGSGLRTLDAGQLANSRLLERLTAFGIELG